MRQIKHAAPSAAAAFKSRISSYNMHPTAQAIYEAAVELIQQHEEGPTVRDLVELSGIHKNTIYGWMCHFREEDLLDWEPDTHPRRLILGKRTPSKEKRPASVPPEYYMTNAEWRKALAFFRYRCAWCGSWADKLWKDEVARMFPWADFGRNENWTGIIVPACGECGAKSHHGDWVENWVSPAHLERVKEWLEMNRDRYIYEGET